MDKHGQGFTGGLCHDGARDWNFLLRFDCDLHRDSEKKLEWKYFRHYCTVRDVMVDPDRFGVPQEALKGKKLTNRLSSAATKRLYDKWGNYKE